MKKALLYFVLLVTAILRTTTTTCATVYEVKHIADYDTYVLSGLRIQMNNNGWIVWNSNFDIYCYDGDEVTQLTQHTVGSYPGEPAVLEYYKDPSIDDGNRVIYQHIHEQGQGLGFWQSLPDIHSSFGWDASDPCHYYAHPRLSGNGHAVFGDWGLAGLQPEDIPACEMTDPSPLPVTLPKGVYLDQEAGANDEGPIRIADTGDYSPLDIAVNDNAQVVWRAYDGSDYYVYFYDGNQITKLSNTPSLVEVGPQINESGHVVWCGKDHEVYLFDGNEIRNLSNTPTLVEIAPRINGDGHVVWRGTDGLEYYVYLYDGIGVRRISRVPILNTGSSGPRINDEGHVVWIGGDHEVYLYDGGQVDNISKTPELFEAEPQINDRDCVLWVRNDGTSNGIYLATPNPLECSCVPDATVLTWGDPLEFETIVSNNSGGDETVYFATNITLPSGDIYPTSGYLLGPWRFTVSPYGSQSLFRSDTVPLGAPLGIYTYRGAVATVEDGVVGLCEFNFELSMNTDPLVTCEVIPVANEVAQGETFQYGVVLTNTTDLEQRFAATIQTWSLQSARLLYNQPAMVRLSANQTRHYDVSLSIEPEMPVGDYALKVIVGTDWSGIWSRDQCVFSVIP